MDALNKAKSMYEMVNVSGRFTDRWVSAAALLVDGGTQRGTALQAQEARRDRAPAVSRAQAFRRSIGDATSDGFARVASDLKIGFALGLLMHRNAPMRWWSGSAVTAGAHGAAAAVPLLALYPAAELVLGVGHDPSGLTLHPPPGLAFGARR